VKCINKSWKRAERGTEKSAERGTEKSAERGTEKSAERGTEKSAEQLFPSQIMNAVPPARIIPTRASLDDVKSYIIHIASTIPIDTQTNNRVPNEQEWIIESGFHVGAHRHVQNWSNRVSVADAIGNRPQGH